MILKVQGFIKQSVPDEENWSVVPNKIPVSLLSVELDRKTSRIPKNRILIPPWYRTVLQTSRIPKQQNTVPFLV